MAATRTATSSVMCWLLAASAAAILLADVARADTPANCTYEDIQGAWLFREGPRGQDKTLDCSQFDSTSTLLVQLEFPNSAIDEEGNVGVWTLIYNQGFEVVVNNRKYFAFSNYTQQGKVVTSYCDTTLNGWSHAEGVNPSDWSCFSGAQVSGAGSTPKPNTDKNLRMNAARQLLFEKKAHRANNAFVSALNTIQSSWKAQHYDLWDGMKIADMVKMAGGKKSTIYGKPKPAPIDAETERLAAALPAAFDWRNVSGVNYVSPVRNQDQCGSCYAFASMAMNEARLRIKTAGASQAIFAPQDIVECSEYSQGCDGGFPYLIGGKYAEDFGLVEESCNPYTGRDGSCSTKASCKRQYSTSYNYIGGFYGACNEALMRIELANNGPIVVGFEVYDDFFSYSGGVYHHTFSKDLRNFRFDPFELTNHAVLVVGYGTEPSTNQDYWIVKNSWGTNWGEDGYFRIRRGNDECAIESLAVASTVVV